MNNFSPSPGRHIVSSTPENDTLETIHYEMVEEIINAAETLISMHPEDKLEQTRKMLYLFVGAMQAFVQSVPGLKEDDTLTLAKKAYELARGQIKSVDESLN
jgi:hypothetical protein